VALEAWYTLVRRPFFAKQDLGPLVYEGALEMLSLAKKERASRLQSMAERVHGTGTITSAVGREFGERIGEACSLFIGVSDAGDARPFLEAFDPAAAAGDWGYIEAIKQLSADPRAKGVAWLQGIVDDLLHEVDRLLPSVGIAGRAR
jgi:hypothetical protein